MQVVPLSPSPLYTVMNYPVLFLLPIHQIPLWEREVLRWVGKVEIRYCRQFLLEIPVLRFSGKHQFQFANHGIATCRGGTKEERKWIRLMIWILYLCKMVIG